jgi:archaeosortase B (VPXXXP-CTERM-specific)
MKVTEYLSPRREFITTPLIFLVFLVLFSKVNYDFQSFSPSLVQGMNSLTARLSAKLLTLFAIKATVEKSYILLPLHSQIEIIYECTGVYILLLFVSFVLSYPTLLFRKMLGIIFGIPLLIIFNLLRIAVLGLFEIYSPGLFDFFHLYLWEATFIAFVLLVAYCWITWIAERTYTLPERNKRFTEPVLKFILSSIFFFVLIRILLNPYVLFQQHFLKTILASDLLGLSTNIGISVYNGVMWLKEERGITQSIHLTHLIFSLVPFLSLTMIIRLHPFKKIISMTGGVFLMVISHTFWLTLVAVRVITSTPGILMALNIYQMFNIALPILLWIPLLYISRRRSGGEGQREWVHTPSSLKPEGSVTYPGLFSTICYLLLGAVSPLLLLLSVFKVNLGYFVAFMIWLLGVTLILPEPPFILQFKDRKKFILLTLFLFWQIPLTASTLMYVPSHQRVGLIHPSGRLTVLEDGAHFSPPFTGKKILLELSSRSFTYPVFAYSETGGKVIDAEARVYYRITPRANFQKIYSELGKNMGEIDQGVSSLCRTAIIWTLSRSGYLKDWQKRGTADIFHSRILTQAQTFLQEYGIVIEKVELTNREGAKVKL